MRDPRKCGWKVRCGRVWCNVEICEACHQALRASTPSEMTDLSAKKAASRAALEDDYDEESSEDEN